jgi:hypothetical protein
LDKERCVIGIIGFGEIGRALATKLIKDGFWISVYDKDPECYKNYPLIDKIEILPTVYELFRDTDVIIGSTGKDTTESFDLLRLKGYNRTILSVSLDDREFNKFLKTLARECGILILDPLSKLGAFTDSKHLVEILYGGYPINFLNTNKKPFTVPADRIALAQALLFAGVMQTIEHMEQNNLSASHTAIPANVMLSPEKQQKIVKNWYETTVKQDDTLPHDLINKFITDKDFVIAHSKGRYVELPTQSKRLRAKL